MICCETLVCVLGGSSFCTLEFFQKQLASVFVPFVLKTIGKLRNIFIGEGPDRIYWRPPFQLRTTFDSLVTFLKGRSWAKHFSAKLLDIVQGRQMIYMGVGGPCYLQLDLWAQSGATSQSVLCSTHWEHACCVDRTLGIPRQLGFGFHMFLMPLLYVSKWVKTNIWLLLLSSQRSNNFAEFFLAQVRPYKKLQVNQKWCAAGRGVANKYSPVPRKYICYAVSTAV